MRREFTKQVMRDAFLRAKGCCEEAKCGARLWAGRFHFDHIIPAALGGDNSLTNCAVLCNGSIQYVPATEYATDAVCDIADLIRNPKVTQSDDYSEK